MGVRFLNPSQAHLWEAEQRAPRPRRATQADRAAAGMEERLDRFETSLRETREALYQMQQTLQAI